MWPTLMQLWQSPWVRRITIGAILAAGIFAALRWYGNSEYQKGVAQGKLAVAEELRLAKEAEWQTRQEELTEALRQINAARVNSDQETARLRQEYNELKRTLTTAGTLARAEREAGYVKAAAVSDDAVWRELRSISTRLGAAGNTGIAGSAPDPR